MPSSHKKSIFITVILILVLVALIIGGIILHKKRQAQLSQVPLESVAPWAVHVATVNSNPVDSGFPALATVSSLKQLSIMAQISGTVVQTGAREGVQVNKGDLLVKLDTREITDKINSLKAQLIAAQAETTRTATELARETRLLNNGGSTKSAVDMRNTAAVAAKQKVKSLQHEIASLNVRRSYGLIKAPAKGIIAQRLVETGDMALPGRPLYKISACSGAVVRVELPQAVLHQVKVGDSIILNYDNKQLVVALTRVFPTLDARALGFVEADIASIPFNLPSASRVACRIVLEHIDDGIQVPYSSLLCGVDQRCQVFKVTGTGQQQIVHQVPVTVKLRGHHAVAIDGALHTGDKVVVAHRSVLLQLKDGDPVTIAAGGLL